MRLVATARALRLGGGRWSGVGAQGRIWRASPPLYTCNCNCRHSSTAPQKQEKDEAESFGPSTINPASLSSGRTVHIGGEAYPLDETSNVPRSILSHIDRRLHTEENHPICIIRELIERRFPRPIYGNYLDAQPVVTTSQNFDILGFPPDHPGRSRTDTYYVNKDQVLRTHTSAHQQGLFKKLAMNEKLLMPETGYTLTADVYRRDAVDRSHYPAFHQMEGARLWNRQESSITKTRSKKQPAESNGSPPDTALIVKADFEALPEHDIKVEDPNPPYHPERNPLQTEYHSPEEVEAMAAHLKRSLEGVVVEVFSKAREAAIAAGDSSTRSEVPLRVRWIEAHFPFTSPSWELEVFWQNEWLELLGCGIVKQELLINSDCQDRIGWAFGMGLERTAMLLFGVPDIRLFWSKDPRFTSQFEAGKISRFVPFSKYPACYKDIAFWLRSTSSAAGGAMPSFHENDMMEAVRDVAGDLAEDVRMVDEFVNAKTGRKSLCYRINYRSLERTLTNEEVNGLHEQVRKELVEKCGVELR